MDSNNNRAPREGLIEPFERRTGLDGEFWPRRRVGLLDRIRSWFAWREVRDAGVWSYQQNTITGARRAIDKGGPWQPVDWRWLGERNGRAIRRDGSFVQF